MSLLSLIVVLVLVGVALYVVQLIPMDATVKRILTIVVIVIVALYVLRALFGASLGDIRI